MANNRIYITCKRCGSHLCIGKHFGNFYFPQEDIEDDLYCFFKKHAFCGEVTDWFSDRGDFEISYESAPNDDEEREV